VDGTCHLIISGGTIKARDGKSEKPDLVIKTPFDVWMDIQTGKADGVKCLWKKNIRQRATWICF
jgi:putative sterol carrier protein